MATKKIIFGPETKKRQSLTFKNPTPNRSTKKLFIRGFTDLEDSEDEHETMSKNLRSNLSSLMNHHPKFLRGETGVHLRSSFINNHSNFLPGFFDDKKEYSHSEIMVKNIGKIEEKEEKNQNKNISRNLENTDTRRPSTIRDSSFLGNSSFLGLNSNNQSKYSSLSPPPTKGRPGGPRLYLTKVESKECLEMSPPSLRLSPKSSFFGPKEYTKRKKPQRRSKTPIPKMLQKNEFKRKMKKDKSQTFLMKKYKSMGLGKSILKRGKSAKREVKNGNGTKVSFNDRKMVIKYNPKKKLRKFSPMKRFYIQQKLHSRGEHTRVELDADE